MPEKKSKLLIPVVGAALVVAGSIACYMYLKNGPAGDISGALETAKVVPNEAIMATYISTDPKVWSKFQQFGTKEAQQVMLESLNKLNKQLLPDSNISYEQDIKPWIGGVMIAMLPPSSTQKVQNPPVTSQQQNNMLMVVGIKDKLSALNFANKLKSEKDITTNEVDYKGEKIIETTSKNKSTYTTILNNTYLVLAPQKQSVEHAIDAYKGEPSFVSKEGAENVLTKGVNVDNTLAQIYVPDYGNMVQKLIAANPQAAQLPPQTLAQSKQVKSMVAGVGVDDVGVRMKVVANLDPQLVKFQYQNSDAKVVSQLPADTMALISGQGISSWWSAFVEQSKDYPELNQALDQLRGRMKLVNIDLDKEVFGWMNGEFAVAAIPSNQSVLAAIGFGGAFVFHTSDRQTAESTLSKLDTLAKTQQVNVAQRNIGGKDVTEWVVPQQGALLSHGWLDQDTVFLALGGPVADAITAPQGQSLDNNENFKAVTGSLQKPNGGYFYLDMDKTMAVLNRFANVQKQPISPEASVILNSIRGLGITATSPDKSTNKMELLLALKNRQ
ncbi:DUF3352 domain-containing protein [Aetokthonos hydrillicola Thurmond2011]|jgi:hypothetical protein|uniref:DUF3352 domain-containing protein n=1 Tax=Aetokthonos hydrillicola Thurmond2011 TaxID=2712845 RepID=A0AAP5I2N5_9CYAN|nr:DUF3352 domain-containing protein [Aetokthonos hydrillicola]MBO3460925.1 DUF3352 domain-containing protein [Aetokthonos hydrillicola CCALA 1050]MBW4586474.1 DUF3352 domain-containing protein [Aetokthonos hydrillicola CCALA 1050]MDR9893581.1 DUF3352 domain-containing protein [Aetokthonos hydrillicola Thurmond2011]